MALRPKSFGDVTRMVIVVGEKLAVGPAGKSLTQARMARAVGDTWADVASGPAGLGCQGAADVDEVVTDDAQTYPALHSAVSFVATATQPVASLEHADAAFTAGPPF